MNLLKRYRRQLVLLTSSLAAFGITGGSCARFPDEIKLIQSIGDASIAASTANLGKDIGTDFGAIFAKPGTAFLQSIWDNFVARQYPRGLDGEKIVRE